MTAEQFLREWHDDNDFIICHTSGSTGTPKEIALPKSEVARSALRTIRFFGLNNDSIFYSCVSPEFIGGKMMIVRADLCNTRCIYETASNRPQLNQEDISAIDLLAVVPSQMIYILDHLKDYPEIRNIIIGGSRIPPDLRSRIIDSGLNCYETYGMTETASHIALRKVGETHFTALDDITVTGVDTPKGTVLTIDIPGWQRVITTDLCEIIDHRNFRIIGRADNVINSGGKKIHPLEIEERLEPLLGRAVLATSTPHPKWGEALHLIIGEELARSQCRQNNIQHINEELVRNVCKTVLESFEQPFKITFTQKLSGTLNGKKLRH